MAFLAGGVVGWMAHAASAAAPSRSRHLHRAALDAHRTARGRGAIRSAGAERHQVQWLSKRLDYEARMLRLEQGGLKLVGGRLLPGPFGPRRSACMRARPANASPSTMHARIRRRPRCAIARVSVPFYWVERGLAYVSGPPDRERLLNVAQAAYDQIDKGASQARP